MAGTSIRGAECKLQAGYHLSVCKNCNCKSLINFKTFVDPAAGNPAGCESWMLRASNFVESYYAATQRQPQMLRIQFKCKSKKQKAKSKKQKAKSKKQKKEKRKKKSKEKRKKKKEKRKKKKQRKKKKDEKGLR